MKRALALLVFLLSLVLLNSCNKNPKEKLSNLIKENIFSDQKLVDALKYRLEVFHIQGDSLTDTLINFYENREYKPVWVLHLADSTFRADLHLFYENLDKEGLDPNWYQYDKIDQILPQLTKFMPSDSLYELMAKAEYLISHSMLSVHKEHAFGRVNPFEIFENQYLIPPRLDSNFNWLQILNASTYRQVYESSKPDCADYDSLVQLMTFYLNEEQNGVKWTSVDTQGITKIEPGDTTNLMPQIAKKLSELGMMPSQDISKASSLKYNREMLGPIKKLQASYGLTDDGVIGRNTLGLLYAGIPYVKMQIAANLERIRWYYADTFNRPFIRVNLPEFMLYMYFQDSILSMKVCIGKQNSFDYADKYARYLKTQKWSDKPKNLETPQIYSKISHVVFHPTWTVPASIVARELFPNILRDKNYLRRNNYIVLYQDKPHPNQDAIDWRKYKPTNIPFKFVQASGDDNALGQIKFMFPNPFFIYLHDTPLKSKFNLTERSVSHGCVRVQNPLQLALFLSTQMDKIDFDDMRIMLGNPPEDSTRLANYDPLDSMAKVKKITDTKSVFLDHRIPVIFDYRTYWWNEAGELQKRNDVYCKNYIIVEAMKNKDLKLSKKSKV